MNSRALEEDNSFAGGLVVFASVMMMVVGTFQFFEGLVAVIDGTEFLVRTENYALQLSTTGWGWIHLLTGALLVLVGAFVLQGNPWARSAAIVIVGFSAMANFAWLPYYPLWAIIVIAVDVFVLWALLRGVLDAG